MRVEPFIKRIGEEVVRASQDAMTPPENPTLFAYGRAVGFYAGMMRAATIFEEMLAEEAKREIRY